MIARRLGYRVMLLERGRHPRFAIGESASPLAGVLLEQLADRYDLPRLRPLSAFGTWQRTYPEVVCGLKRGFSYFKHERDQRYRVADDATNRRTNLRKSHTQAPYSIRSHYASSVTQPYDHPA